MSAQALALSPAEPPWGKAFPCGRHGRKIGAQTIAKPLRRASYCNETLRPMAYLGRSFFATLYSTIPRARPQDTAQEQPVPSHPGSRSKQVFTPVAQ